MMQAVRVALFGGTFDPIHEGHLAAARAVLERGLVDEVVFVPAGDPPHKRARTLASAHDRYVMTVLATLNEPRFRVVPWELERAGPSYTVDTLEHARAVLGAVDVYWLIGADAAWGLHTWQQAQRLVTLTRFLVVSREGFDEDGLRAQLALHFPACDGDWVQFVRMPEVAVSSTALRAACAAGRSPDGLPQCVAAFIARYGLYRERMGDGL
jgi:nicotinate-nucleotide adenylyltransferase